MQRMVRILGMLLALCLGPVAGQNLAVAGEAEDAAYVAIVAQAKQDVDHVDFGKMRELYVASSFYKKDDSDPANLQSSLPPEQVRQFLDDNFAILNTHVVAMSLVPDKNSPEHIMHLKAARGLFRAIIATADGKSAKTAFHVLTVSEEYFVLGALKLKVQNQSLSQAGGVPYDVIKALNPDTGNTFDIWFDISAFFP